MDTSTRWESHDNGDFQVFPKWNRKVASPKWSRIIMRSFWAIQRLKFTVKMRFQTPPDPKSGFSLDFPRFPQESFWPPRSKIMPSPFWKFLFTLFSIKWLKRQTCHFQIFKIPRFQDAKASTSLLSWISHTSATGFYAPMRTRNGPLYFRNGQFFFRSGCPQTHCGKDGKNKLMHFPANFYCKFMEKIGLKAPGSYSGPFRSYSSSILLLENAQISIFMISGFLAFVRTLTYGF